MILDKNQYHGNSKGRVFKYHQCYLREEMGMERAL